MKRWLTFLGLADDKNEKRLPFLGQFASILIFLAPVTVIVGKLSMGAVLVGAASFSLGIIMILLLKRTRHGSL